jgi:hypothetical protein
MRALRPGILGGIDVRFHDVPEVVDVIAEPGRDVVFVFPHYFITPRRGGEPRLAGGDSRFTHHRFSFEEIGALLADIDDDLRRSRNAIAVPSVGERRNGSDGGGSRFHFGATGEKDERAQGGDGTE